MKGQPKISYGHWVLVAGFLTLFVVSGVGFYSFGLLFKPIQEEFNWARAETSAAFTVFYIAQALCSPFIGRLTNRYGPKKIITLGALATGFGLMLLSLITNLTHFYAAYAVMGLGASAMGMIPVSAVISEWFVKNRGAVMGVASSGVGAAGLVLAPIVGTLLIPSLGWRMTYQVLALLTWVPVVTIVQLVMKASPRDVKLRSDSVETSKIAENPGNMSQSSGEWRLKAALRTSTFWFIVGAFIMYNIAQVGTIQHLVNHLTDIGFSAASAATALSYIGLGSTIGKFLFGYLSDRLAAKLCTAISFLLVLAATAILITVDSTSSLVVVWLYALVMGLGVGGWAPLTSVLTSQNFGLANYGVIYGVVSLFVNVSTGVGPIVFGYVYDATQAYYWAFIASLALCSAAIAIILALQRPRAHSFSRG